jgi:hypothetical protein
MPARQAIASIGMAYLGYAAAGASVCGCRLVSSDPHSAACADHGSDACTGLGDPDLGVVKDHLDNRQGHQPEDTPNTTQTAMLSVELSSELKRCLNI